VVQEEVMLKIGLRFSAALAVLAVAGLSQAKVPQEVADALLKGPDAPLTPNGAIRAGNAEGTIGPWEPMAKPPANFESADKGRPDPYADEKPLFTITAQNYQQYADKLSLGAQEMFKRFPDTYRMHVYPTHRSWAAPDWIYQANLTNATTVELSQSGNDPEEYWRGASCFPIPSSGNEMRLNTGFARCQYLSEGGYLFYNVSVVDVSGDWVTAQIEEWIAFPHHNPDVEPGSVIPEFKILQIIRAPARLAGTATLLISDVNYERQGGNEKAWQYNPGQRRVRRAPQIQYDYPKNGSNGLLTTDQASCEGHGNIDRYTWTVVGRREMYVPYNTYKLKDRSLKEADLFHRNHLNQDLVRYELHRVWEVVGDQKDEFHMAIDKRVQYFDEDNHYAAQTDIYDKFGNLWRFSECHTTNLYDIPMTWFGVESKYDFSSRSYVIQGVDQASPTVAKFRQTVPDQTFSIGNMKGMGVR
jgi:hypothetical protein